jgi:hypothetical protein
MKLRELIDNIVRIMTDTAPRSSYYAHALREHLFKKHRDILDEEVVIK